MKELNEIQKKLKAPKGQLNKFGNYNYRSCEDILEAVKPLLNGSDLTITDEIVMIGNRYYVKATAILMAGERSVSVTAYAREAEEKKGMDVAQITGAASSYARKYALNGLFLIDDTKDADTTDNTKQEPSISSDMQCEAANISELLMACETLVDLNENAKNYKEAIQAMHITLQADIKEVYRQKKAELTKKEATKLTQEKKK